MLEEHRMIFTENEFRQEYMCEFLDGEDGLFLMDKVRALFNDDITDLNL